MQAQTPKQDALEAIQQLPDSVDFEDILYRLYVLENIRRGQKDAATGRSETAQDLLKDIQTS